MMILSLLAKMKVEFHQKEEGYRLFLSSCKQIFMSREQFKLSILLIS